MDTALMRTVQLILTNKSGGAVAQGDVVVIDTTTQSSFTTTTTGAYVGEPIGVVLEPNGIANNGSGMIAIGGYVPVINLSASASLGDFVRTHTVAKQGVRHATPSTAGDFAVVLNTGTTPPAFLFGSTVQVGTSGVGATVGTGDVASLPSPGTSGDVYLPNNGLQLYRSTGAAQVPWGPVYPFTTPDDSAFAWINQVGASVDLTNGGIYLAAAVENPCQTHARSIAVPAAPYTITVALLPNILDYKFRFGLALFDNTGKYAALDIENAEAIQIINVASMTATGWSSPGGNWGFDGSFSMLSWLRVNDDNAGNRNWYHSMDGQHFNLVYTEGSTTYITPTKVGIYVTGTNTLGATSGVNLLSWKQT